MAIISMQQEFFETEYKKLYSKFFINAWDRVMSDKQFTDNLVAFRQNDDLSKLKKDLIECMVKEIDGPSLSASDLKFKIPGHINFYASKTTRENSSKKETSLSTYTIPYDFAYIFTKGKKNSTEVIKKYAKYTKDIKKINLHEYIKNKNINSNILQSYELTNLQVGIYGSSCICLFWDTSDFSIISKEKYADNQDLWDEVQKIICKLLNIEYNQDWFRFV